MSGGCIGFRNRVDDIADGVRNREMHKAHLASDLKRLFSRKQDAVRGITAVDGFVTAAVKEACLGSDIAIFGHLTKAGGLLPTELSEQIPEIDRQGRPAYKIPEGRMRPFVRSQLFISLMAELEDMFAELARRVLLAFPLKAAEKKISISDLFDSYLLGEMLNTLVEAELSALFYAGPEKLKSRMEEIISGVGILDPVWPAYREMRARRDIGLHAGWKPNRVYVEKAGGNAASDDSKSLYPDEAYFSEACKVALEMCEILGTHCSSKFASCKPGEVFKEMWLKSPLENRMSYDEAWSHGSTPIPTEKGKKWGWSGSEKAYYDFFRHIHNFDNYAFNVATLFQRWPGSGSSVVRAWLERPFFL